MLLVGRLFPDCRLQIADCSCRLQNNFGRIHRTLRVTPAMEAGVANHVRIRRGNRRSARRKQIHHGEDSGIQEVRCDPVYQCQRGRSPNDGYRRGFEDDWLRRKVSDVRYSSFLRGGMDGRSDLGGPDFRCDVSRPGNLGQGSVADP